MSSADHSPVTRRRVFYIPGYDPIPPRRYRELYRTESAAQAAVSGYEIAMGGKTEGSGFGWYVSAQFDDQPVEARIDVLTWSDIVQSSMSASIAGTYLQLLRTVWIYISTGAFWRLMRLRKGPVLAALYPIGMLLLQLQIAAWVCWLTFRVVPFGGGIPGFVLGVVLGVMVLRWFKSKDGKIFAYYLMHDFAYAASRYGAYPPELEPRLQAFGDQIAQTLSEDVDEVLVVGHSSGAHLAISVLADLVRAGRVTAGGPALGFLSLGQVVPMITFLPQAHRLRADLRYLSTRSELAWVDVTAPGDGCSFALCDPVGVSGQTTPEKRLPLVFSAAFTQSLSPSRWRSLRWRFFRLHFQYLCAFDRPKDYDYFQITAGPQTLAARYSDRAASRSRIQHCVTKYTSTAP